MARVPENLSPIVNINGIERYIPPMEEVRGLAWGIGEAVLRSSFNIKHIVAITRGGLTPTDCVSRSMGIKDIQVLAIEHYLSEPDLTGTPVAAEGGVKIYREPKLAKDGEGALFVDDVLDQGHTAAYVSEKWPKAPIAVVYTKHGHADTLSKVAFYGRFVGDIWVDFPWEVEEQRRRELRQLPNRAIY